MGLAALRLVGTRQSVRRERNPRAMLPRMELTRRSVNGETRPRRGWDWLGRFGAAFVERDCHYRSGIVDGDSLGLTVNFQYLDFAGALAFGEHT